MFIESGCVSISRRDLTNVLYWIVRRTEARKLLSDISLV